MKEYEVTCVGNFTRDTIKTAAGRTVVAGGGFNYGCHAARALGKRTAAVTRLAREDVDVIAALERIDVDVYPSFCPQSTCLSIEYPTENPDERVLTVTSLAAPIGPDEVAGVRSRAFVVGPSFRGEVELETLQLLSRGSEILSIDAQGFIRTVVDGTLEYRAWPERETIFSIATILKVDSVEAQFLTGESDHRRACRALHAEGAREVILTHRGGIVVFDGHRFYEAPFIARRNDGRSGRGDTCVASYVSSRLTEEPKEAIRWSAALTSLKLEVPGPFTGTHEEVRKLVEERYHDFPRIDTGGR